MVSRKHEYMFYLFSFGPSSAYLFVEYLSPSLYYMRTGARSVLFTVSFLRIHSCDMHFAQLCELFIFSLADTCLLRKALWEMLGIQWKTKFCPLPHFMEFIVCKRKKQRTRKERRNKPKNLKSKSSLPQLSSALYLITN